MPIMTPEKVAEMDEKLRTLRASKPVDSAKTAVALTTDRKAEMDEALKAMRSGAAPTSKKLFQDVEKKPNLLQSIAKPFTKAASNVLAAGQGIGELGAAGLSKLTGDEAGYQEHVKKASEAQSSERDFGFLGKARPVGRNQETGEMLSITRSLGDIVGTGLEVGSFATPVGSSGKVAFQALKTGGLQAAKPLLGKAVAQGVKFGATAGGLSSAGRSMAEGDDLKTGLLRTGVGTVAGGVVGGAIPALSFGARSASKGIKDGLSSSGKYLTSQASGLSPETVSLVRNKPELGKRILEGNALEERIALGDRAKSALDDHLDDLSTTGKQYQVVRDNAPQLRFKRTESGVPDFVDDVLKRHGLVLDGDGVIQPLNAKTRLKTGDSAALQKFIDQYAKAPIVKGNEFLNTRQALDDLAHWERDPSLTGATARVAKDLRSAYDTVGKTQIPGLRQLDAKFGPDKKFADEMKALLFDKHGQLKDNAYTTLANLTNKSNIVKRSKMERLMPGISDDVLILKAIDDVANTGGQKTGTYLRGAVGGAGVLSMNPVLIAYGVFGTPQNFIRAIQAFGYANQGKFLTDSLIRKITSGKSLTALERVLVNTVITSASREASRKKQE